MSVSTWTGAVGLGGIEIFSTTFLTAASTLSILIRQAMLAKSGESCSMRLVATEQSLGGFEASMIDLISAPKGSGMVITSGRGRSMQGDVPWAMDRKPR